MHVVYFLRPGLPGARYELHRRRGEYMHSECIDTFDNKGAALARLRGLQRRADAEPEEAAALRNAREES